MPPFDTPPTDAPGANNESIGPTPDLPDQAASFVADLHAAIEPAVAAGADVVGHAAHDALPALIETLGQLPAVIG